MLKINRNIWVVSWVSLLTDISSEMLYPVIPIFLTSVLGASMAVVGLIEGLAEATASLLKVASGWFSDKFARRKPFVVFGYTISSFSKPLIALAQSWPLVLFARFLDRFGKGVRTAPRDALIADYSDNKQHGLIFGLHRTMDTIGALSGPLLTILLLIWLKENYRPIFLLAAIPGFLAVFLLIFFLKEPPNKNKIFNPPQSPPHRIGGCADAPISVAHVGGSAEIHRTNFLDLSDFDKNFKNFLLVSVIFALGNSSDVFLIMRSKNLGLSTILVILAYVLYNATYAIISLPAGAISDKIGRKKILALGFLIFSLVYFGFAFISKSFYLWLLFPIYGFYMAMTEGVSKAFISDLVPSEKRGTAIGLYYSLTGVVTFLASFIAGLLWTYVNISAPFLYGALMSGLSAVLLMILLDKGK